MGKRSRGWGRGKRVVGYRVVVYGLCAFYLVLMLVYSRFGYKHCRSAELADDYLRSHGPLLPLDELPTENGTLVVTVASRPWCLGTLNWVVAASRAGLRHVLVVNLGPGELLCDAVRALDLGAECVTVAGADADGEGLQRTANFGESVFFDLMTVRTAVIYELLQRGHDILFSDADVVLLQNPLPTLLSRVHAQNLDLLAQRDYGKLFDYFFDPICAGFMFFHNTEKTRTFWRSVLSFVLQHPSRNDQKAVNMCGRDPALGLAYDTLEPNQFPDGYRFFFQNEGLVPAGDSETADRPSTVATTKPTTKEDGEETMPPREEYTFVEPSADMPTAQNQQQQTAGVNTKSSVQPPPIRLRRDFSKKFMVHANWLASEKKIAKMMGEGLWMLPPELSQLCGALE